MQELMLARPLKRNVVPWIGIFLFVAASISPGQNAQSDPNARRKPAIEAPGYSPVLPDAAKSSSLRDESAGFREEINSVPEPASSGRSSASVEPDPKSLQNLWKHYNAAVEHVSVWRNEDVRRLKPLVVGPDGTVEVVTATKYEITSPLYGDTWVTIVPEIQTKCRSFTGDVAMQLREVLGLPPDHEIPNIFVMRVKPADIFRPTPDPTPWTLCPCGNPLKESCTFAAEVECGNRFPKDVAVSHQQWIASTTMSVHRMPNGYPWTHLGYTFNWASERDIYGASEYIVRKGAEVKISPKVSPEEYCRP